MNLIAYSDSESETEAPPVPKPVPKPASKPAFQKVVDRSNPGRIKVNLPGASQVHAEKDDIETEARPAKKPRIGGGAFSGFNAMLPAPKKPNVNAATAEAASGKRGLGKGLGSGVNLKTGAEPAFQRSSKVELDDYDENGNPIKKEALKKEDFRAMLNLPPPKTEAKGTEKAANIIDTMKPEVEKEVKPVSVPRFVPMSVGRGKKKKPVAARAAMAPIQDTKPSSTAASTVQSTSSAPKPAVRPKVSLFGVSQETETPPTAQSSGEYQPLLYGNQDEEDAPIPEAAFEEQPTYHTAQYSSAGTSATPSNDLTNIASELKLSKAEQRQLLGRRGQGSDISSARIVDFNTDTEYAHNEMLRQQGETVQHNPLKSISGTGKNSLRSLVNVAQTQKDALEEHLATGRRNKKEAGSKYGW